MAHPSHKNQIVPLKRIEGQVRGIQRMIEDGRYCVDILIQLQSVIKAVESVKVTIYRKHLEQCLVRAARSKSDKELRRKINEITDLFRKYQRSRK